MAKILIGNISSGFASTSTLNTAFDAIEAELNNKVLYRDNPSGEPNAITGSPIWIALESPNAIVG